MESAARSMLRAIFRRPFQALLAHSCQKRKERKEKEEYHAKGLILILANICLAICRADVEHEVTDESIHSSSSQ